VPNLGSVSEEVFEELLAQQVTIQLHNRKQAHALVRIVIAAVAGIVAFASRYLGDLLESIPAIDLNVFGTTPPADPIIALNEVGLIMVGLVTLVTVVNSLIWAGDVLLSPELRPAFGHSESSKISIIKTSSYEEIGKYNSKYSSWIEHNNSIISNSNQALRYSYINAGLSAVFLVVSVAIFLASNRGMIQVLLVLDLVIGVLCLAIALFLTLVGLAGVVLAVRKGIHFGAGLFSGPIDLTKNRPTVSIQDLRKEGWKLIAGVRVLSILKGTFVMITSVTVTYTLTIYSVIALVVLESMNMI